MVFKKDSSLTPEERRAKTMAIYKECYGDDLEEMLTEEWLPKTLEKYEENEQYLVLKKRVEYGGEEAINEIMDILFEGLGIEDITYEWDEC